MLTRILSEIWLHPVKSLGGQRVGEARVLGKGLEYDRRWMLIDSNHQFLTQRVLPALALFQVRIENGHLALHFQKSSERMSLDARIGDLMAATVWNDTVEVHRCSNEVDEWFSEHVHQEVRLVAFPETSPRQVDVQYSASGDWVSLADGYPFLIIGQASLDDLNSRLQSPVPMNRFRPNFVFTGGEAYEEDTWREFSVGTINFLGVKPCSRCVMVTVDQATGQGGVEPLATLSRYRKQNGKVYFGQNVLARSNGTVREGDKIVIQN
jgi:uncharacterized protein YcbX